MNFSDLRFWLLLLLVLGVALGGRAVATRLIPTHLRLYDHAALACVNLALFFSADARSCAILLTELLLTFWLIRVALRGGSATRTACLGVLVLLHLAVLGYFKYSRFFIHDLFGYDWRYAPLGIPAGISFYTFQKLALAIDTVRNDRPLPQGFNFLNYNTFFPQLVAGPIERRSHLLPQIENFSLRPRLENLERAVPLLVLGLFYKLVLADNLAAFELRALDANAYAIWLTNLLFGLRIYFDFCGYSTIALGLARLFGVELTVNFRAPYAAASIREFWQRWHISLSTWFRDYLYIPMGGSRRGSHSLNLFVVFLVSGFWHGAGVNFLLWGAWHGLLMILNGWTGRLTGGWTRFVSRPLTLLCVLFSWLFFYEGNLRSLRAKVAATVNWHAYTPDFLKQVLAYYAAGDRVPLAFCLALALLFLAVEYRHRNRPNPCEPLLDWRVSCLLAFLLVLFTAGENSPFIYFAF